jgi:hypothetical protein
MENVVTEKCLLNRCLSLNFRLCLASRWLAMDARCCGNVHSASRWLATHFRSGSAIPAFRRRVKVLHRILFCFQRFVAIVPQNGPRSWNDCYIVASDGPGQHQSSVRTVIYILTACFWSVSCLFHHHIRLWINIAVYTVNKLKHVNGRILYTDPEVPGSIPGATRFSEK